MSVFDGLAHSRVNVVILAEMPSSSTVRFSDLKWQTNKKLEIKDTKAKVVQSISFV